MKKFLSLVLALVMTMSLVTVSAGAKDFTDDETITYSEAVAVVSEVGIVDGYGDGTFKPTNTLTRQAAAKIICNLILGPTTASELHANVAPYPDVPTTSEFAGYIAYCQQRGIISGYGDGTFKPGNTLTGYAFMKMLLGALGYDSTLEGYAGNANWSINVAKQALGIGLAAGLEEKDGAVFNGLKAVNREEACLYAFNTLQADLVEYGQRLTTSINGTEVVLSSGGAQSRPWQSQQTRINNIREDDIVQFAEEYFKKLEKRRGRDDFERPGYTWLYDKEEIGTYVDWSLQVGEDYTTGVSGRDLYDLLGSTNLRDNDLTYYANGLVPGTGNPTASNGNSFAAGGQNIVVTSDVTRANQKSVGITGRGVLTQVFLDKDHEEITVTSISTFLAQATGDYNEKREDAAFDVHSRYHNRTLSKTVDVDDCGAVVDAKEDDWFLAKITWKHNPGTADANGDVVELVAPEILDDSTVTKFSATNTGWGGANYVAGQHVEKLTVGGTEYKDNANAYYDTNVLDLYEENLLTDNTYNVYLDEYGYFIGVELFEGTKNYVFITGFDRPTSNLSIKTADAAAIFLDGTMQTVKVNVTATNDNIKEVNKHYAPGTTNERQGEYFLPWDANLQVGAPDAGMYALNRWFTYTTNADGVYTLKPATRMVIYKYTTAVDGDEVKLKTDNLFVDDNVMNPAVPAGAATGFPYAAMNSNAGLHGWAGGPNWKYSIDCTERAYGNDDSVFLTVDTDLVDTSRGNALAITEVTGVYTGIQSSEIDVEMNSPLEEAQVYAVYNSDNYIIGAVIDGEGDGGTGTIAYVTSGPKSERVENGVYYWEFDAVMNGTVQTLTVKDTSRASLDDLRRESDGSHKAIGAYIAGRSATDPTPATADRQNWNLKDGLVELRFDADNYVTSIRTIAEKDIYSYFGDKLQGDATKPGFGGHDSSYTGAQDTYTPATYPVGATVIRTSDARAYRVNGINSYMVGKAKTWDENAADGKYNHYDSAPNALTLVGRTLYATSDQHDEGLALATDAKAVLIQWENGDWETTEYGTVKGAVNNVALNPVTGAFEGEIVAALNSNGTAAWVVITSYNEVRRGGNVNPGQQVYNVAVQYIDPDNTGANLAGDEYTAFKLYGTTAGKQYTVTMHTSFGGVTTTRTKTVTGTAGTTLCDSTGLGFYGKLSENTQITITCEEGVGTYQVLADGANAIRCTL